jgi:hypothetical protein
MPLVFRVDVTALGQRQAQLMVYGFFGVQRGGADLRLQIDEKLVELLPLIPVVACRLITECVIIVMYPEYGSFHGV